MTHFLKTAAENFFALVFQLVLLGVFAGFAIGGGWMIWEVITVIRHLFNA